MMEREKLSIKRFNEIKKILNKLIQEADNLINLSNSNESILDDIMFYEYSPLLSKLLSYDLSDIPFENWQDLELFTMYDKPIDFSGTKANIDFNFLKLKQKGIFIGCNVKNLENRINYINEDVYDYEVIKENPELFLSNKFSDEERYKIYNDIITIEFLSTLTSEQIEELKTRKMITKLNYKFKEFNMVRFLGIDKTLELYNNLSHDYYEISNILNNYALGYERKLNIKDTLKSLETDKIKEVCYKLLRESILEDKFVILHKESFTEEFINNNKDIFLDHIPLSNGVKNRWYKKQLTYYDVVNNLDIFIDLPIDKFMEECDALEFIKGLGPRNFQMALKNHQDVIEHLIDYKYYPKLLNYYNKNVEFDIAFSNAVKYYYIDTYLNNRSSDYDNNINLPYWISSMNFKIKDKINNAEELELITNKTIVLDKDQDIVFRQFGVENIKRFQKEFKLFNQNDNNNELVFLKLVGMYLKNTKLSKIPQEINYDEFTDLFAEILDEMRYKGFFQRFVTDYEFIEGEFRDKYPFLFISENAPERLKSLFYEGDITAEELRLHKEYIPFLLDNNLKNVIKGNYNSTLGNFVELYSEKFGNEALLNLFSKYGKLCTNITTTTIFSTSTKDEIETKFRENIYKNILSNKFPNYNYLIESKEDEEISKFISEYPFVFIEYDSIPIDNEKEKQDFYKRFYEGNIIFNDVFKHPELIPYLKDKELRHLCRVKDEYGNMNYSPKLSKIIDLIGNENVLLLFSKYGNYLNPLYKYIDLNSYPYSSDNTKKYIFDRLCGEIEDTITQHCLHGLMKYNIEDAPEFLKNKHPEIFLDEDAPQDLKNHFYGNVDNGTRFDFYLLKNHPEWIPYLKEKSAYIPFLRKFHNKSGIMKYFTTFGQETALKLGIQKTTSVMEMIDNNQIELMKEWYDKTGQKFIPDFIIMQNFPIEQSDKFFTSAQKWRSLIEIERYSDEYETKDALLKLAYSFGVFDNDQLGFKKLKELLTGIPKTIQVGGDYIISSINSFINNPKLSLSSEKEEYMKIIDTLEEEGYQFNSSKTIFEQIYKKNSDGSYTLIMNQQNYPKSSKLIRELLENFSNLIHILDPEKSHQLFSGFDFKYDKDFRDFLISNLDKILENSEYGRFLPNIQKQFEEIKFFNSNRTLTLDLAISFVQNNKYYNIEVGNERVAEISSIAGYSQSDFDTLQEIYNYGKQRTFSSIPRIENNDGIYTYEMLRLDDPLAMAIGTLTDCCQELGNVAEGCMEHSMVDKNGRIFVIRDDNGNIVSQSWVWRNKDVLCFDNIEIPDKAFNRAKKDLGLSSRRDFTDKIYNIYKKAAQELIEEDEKVYKKLLDEGKITNEQYQGLRLGKITVGLGYNDIAESLKFNSQIDKGEVARPLNFEQPVKLDRNLYTKDSTTQYILEQREDRIEYEGDTLTIHPDTYQEYTDKDFTLNNLIALQKLEKATKDDPYYLETEISEANDSINLVSSLANNYGLDSKLTKIIMHPNFAVIYEVNENSVKIADLLYNPIITSENEKSKTILIQIKLALEQISKNKNIDTNNLSDDAKKIFNQALNINEEIDIERGIKHAK